jgi:peptide/nickel transport system permease protein
MRSFCVAALEFVGHLLVAGFLATMLVRLAPGFGTDERELDPRYSHAFTKRPEAEVNIVSAYFRYLRQALAGDLGESGSLGRPVAELLRERAPVTARNVSAGFILAWVAALGVASLSSITGGRITRPLAGMTGAALLCIPSALVAFVTVLLQVAPAAGIAAVLFPRIHRYADNLFRSAEVKTYVLAARAQGLRRASIFRAHVFRSTLPQIIALAGVSVNTALSAAIPIEALCDQPGVGQLAWKAALSRDVHLVVTIALAVASVTLLANRAANAAIHGTGPVRA